MGSNFFNLDEALEGKDQNVNKARDAVKGAVKHTVEDPAKQAKQQLDMSKDISSWLYGTPPSGDAQEERGTESVGQQGHSQQHKQQQHSQIAAISPIRMDKLTNQPVETDTKSQQDHHAKEDPNSRELQKKKSEHQGQHRRMYYVRVDRIATIADIETQIEEQRKKREKEEEEREKQKEQEEQEKKEAKKKEQESELPMPRGKVTGMSAKKASTTLRREQTKAERVRGTSG